MIKLKSLYNEIKITNLNSDKFKNQIIISIIENILNLLEKGKDLTFTLEDLGKPTNITIRKWLESLESKELLKIKECFDILANNII